MCVLSLSRWRSEWVRKVIDDSLLCVKMEPRVGREKLFSGLTQSFYSENRRMNCFMYRDGSARRSLKVSSAINCKHGSEWCQELFVTTLDVRSLIGKFYTIYGLKQKAFNWLRALWVRRPSTKKVQKGLLLWPRSILDNLSYSVWSWAASLKPNKNNLHYHRIP